MKDIFRFIKFSLVGASNTLITIACYWICINVLKINFLMSNTIAYVFGVINSYFWNTKWVFKDSTANNKLIKFIIVNLVALSASNLCIFILVKNMNINIYAGQLAAIGFSMIINFVLNKSWTYEMGMDVNG